MSETAPSTGQRLVDGDGSAIPARLRIVAWITLATGLVLLAVTLTIRSALIAEAERVSNDNIAQEVDEFRTFAVEGRDPETGAPFADGVRLLELYLQRQFPGRGELLAGWDHKAEDVSASVLLQDVERGFEVDEPIAIVETIIEDEATSGVSAGEEEFRWAKSSVLDDAGQPSATFIIVEFAEPARSEAAKIVRLVTLVCLGGLALTALIAFAVAGAILAPVRAVREAAAGITRADIEQRIQIRGRDDVAALAATFNAMLDRLELSIRAQQRFVRTAEAHVRQPLDVIVDSRSSSRERNAAALEIRTTLDDMALLTASQLPGFAQTAEEPLEDVGKHLSMTLQERYPQHVWALDLRAQGVALVDLPLLTKAVLALAHNAIAHHPSTSPLSLQLLSDDRAFEVSIGDDGPGLDPVEAGHLLDRFSDRDRTSDSGHDPGLGLAVVRAVADAHEGEAWVETAPGEGARFGLRLPRALSSSEPVE